MRKLVEFNGDCFVPYNKISHVKILNIGAGKINPIDIRNFDRYFLVNLDTMYNLGCNSAQIENMHTLKDQDRFTAKCNDCIDKFLENYYYRFNLITMYRYLEHVPFDNVLYFIYKLSTALELGGYIDVIVPDYKTLARRILSEDPGELGFESHNILVTTELLNTPSDPHASIWTVDRIIHFFRLEGRFEVVKYFKNYKFDGRDIYIRAIIERIN